LFDGSVMWKSISRMDAHLSPPSSIDVPSFGAW
jgi:hypothetical protein